MKKILIVDDSDDVRKSLSELLQTSGYQTEIASSGREAIKKVSSEDFDIALIDLMMPEMGGIDVLKEFKRLKPQIQVIIITAFPALETAVDAIKAGANNYIIKPFRPDELLTKINYAIEEARFKGKLGRLHLDKILNSLSSPTRRKIIRLLYSKPRIQFNEIVKELNFEDHTRVVYHLRLLKEDGMVGQDRKTYSLTEAGEKALDYLKHLEKHFS